MSYEDRIMKKDFLQNMSSHKNWALEISFELGLIGTQLLKVWSMKVWSYSHLNLKKKLR